MCDKRKIKNKARKSPITKYSRNRKEYFYKGQDTSTDTIRLILLLGTSIKRQRFELLNPHEWLDRVHANQEHARQPL